MQFAFDRTPFRRMHAALAAAERPPLQQLLPDEGEPLDGSRIKVLVMHAACNAAVLQLCEDHIDMTITTALASTKHASLLLSHDTPEQRCLMPAAPPLSQRPRDMLGSRTACSWIKVADLT